MLAPITALDMVYHGGPRGKNSNLTHPENLRSEQCRRNGCFITLDFPGSVTLGTGGMRIPSLGLGFGRFCPGAFAVQNSSMIGAEQAAEGRDFTRQFSSGGDWRSMVISEKEGDGGPRKGPLLDEADGNDDCGFPSSDGKGWGTGVCGV